MWRPVSQEHPEPEYIQKNLTLLSYFRQAAAVDGYETGLDWSAARPFVRRASFFSPLVAEYEFAECAKHDAWDLALEDLRALLAFYRNTESDPFEVPLYETVPNRGKKCCPVAFIIF